MGSNCAFRLFSEKAVTKLKEFFNHTCNVCNVKKNLYYFDTQLINLYYFSGCIEKSQ